METLVLYASPMSSATPVVLAMTELGVPHEVVLVDLVAGEQHEPEFLDLNPGGKVPTLVVDGMPMFEALAIMQWLGERYGVERGLWPAPGTPERLEALSWSCWAYVSFGGALQRYIHATGDRVPTQGHSDGQEELAMEQLQSFLGVLDGRLRRTAYLLGETFSLLDLIVGSVVAYAALCGVSTPAHEHVDAWVRRFRAREAYAKVWGAH